MTDGFTITAKLGGGKQAAVKVQPDMDIKQVKELLAEPLGLAANENRLIFKGRITKNEDKVQTVGLAEGCVVHVLKTPEASKAATPSPAAPGPAASPPAAAPASAAPPNPMAGMAGMGGMGGLDMSQMAQMMQSMSGSGSGSGNLGAANPFAGIPPEMLAGMGGGAGFNPAMISQMLQNPQMQQMIGSLTRNPEMMSQMLRSNPLLSSMAQSNPMVQNLLNNPDQLSAMLSGGLPGAPPPAAAAAQAPPAGAADPLAGLLNDPNMMAQMQGMMNNPEMMRMMQQMGMGGMAPPANSNEPPETRFAMQLTQLEEMGFIDRAANLQVIQESHGDLDAAITKLITRGMGN